MLKRPPTRIELTIEDAEELDNLQLQRVQAAPRPAVAQSSGLRPAGIAPAGFGARPGLGAPQRQAAPAAGFAQTGGTFAGVPMRPS